MNFRHLAAFGTLALPLLLGAAPKLTITTDLKHPVCKAGDTVTFKVRCLDNGKPVADKKLSGRLYTDKLTVVEVTTDADGKALITGKLDRPGEIQLFFGDRKDKKTLFAQYGVLVDPEKIQPGLPAPADFNAFWDREKAIMDKMPLDAEITPVKSDDPAVAAYSVKLSAPDGAPAYGYLTLPANAKAKSLPARLMVYGAGTYSVKPLVEQAKTGVMVFTLNPHSLPNGKPAQYYLDARKNELRNYRYADGDNRDKIYFKSMFQRDYRALQFLTSRPEWDGKILMVSGTSQGGGQTLACAGLEPRVTAIVSHVPAICDHGGFTAERESGWPRFNLSPAYKKNPQKTLEATKYVDGVNFARNIKNAECFISTGYSDRTCVSTSVCAAYNVIPSVKKQLVGTPNADHAVPAKVIKQGEDFLRAHIKAMQAK